MKFKIIAIGTTLLSLGLASATFAKDQDFRWDELTTVPNLVGYVLKHSNDNRETFNGVDVTGVDNTQATLDLSPGMNYVHVVGTIFDGTTYSYTGQSNEIATFINDGTTSSFTNYNSSPYQHLTFKFVNPDTDYSTIPGGSISLIDIDDKKHAFFSPPDMEPGQRPTANVPLSALNNNFNNPILIANLYNDSAASDLGLMVKDKEGKYGEYHPVPGNFSSARNSLLARLSDPSYADDGFDTKEISDTYLEGDGLNLEGMVLEEGGIPITGNMVKGINVTDIGNSADFDQDPLYNTISGKGLKLTKRFLTASSAINVNLGNYKEILLMLDMDAAKRSLLGNNGIQVGLDGIQYTLPKDDIIEGFGIYTMPLQSSGTATSASLTINTAARLNRRVVKEYFKGYIGIR